MCFGGYCVQKRSGKIIICLRIFSIFAYCFCVLKHVLVPPIEIQAQSHDKWQTGNFYRFKILNQEVDYCQEISKITAIKAITVLSITSDKEAISLLEANSLL